MRTQLSNGTILTLSGKEYRILNVIGDGASCIVYDVCSTNTFGITQRYRLKECYPYNSGCRRDGSRLVWDDESRQKSAFDRFTNSAKIIADLRNEESIGNNITGTELVEGNGTLYALMEVNYARTYQQDQTQDLHRILQTMLKLTRIVGKLHDQGYLHLDIKPENFLVNYDPEPTIWLFDVDSLTAQADLNSGKTTCYSYSKEWAAPELTQGKLNKICCATDLFSIGAILFRKVMERPVSNDDIGLFPEWDFDGKAFENVNPKVKRILQEIFEKTLSATVKYRYQRASDLCSALEKACKIAESGKPFIQTDLPCVTNDFIGRQHEIEKIHQSLQAGNAVFLHGFAGIGKSSLAIAYAQQHKQQYGAILFLRYHGSLNELLLEINIANFDGSDKEQVRLLKRLLDEGILIIIDNFDIAVDEDDYLDEFLRLPAKKIFTTRTNFANVYSGQIHQIEISPLPPVQLIQLFSQSAKKPMEMVMADPATESLLKALSYHTLGTILTGRQIAVSGCSINNMYEQYTNGFADLCNAEDIKVLKDGRTRRGTIPMHIRVLFNLASLTEKHKSVLRNVYVLSQVVKVDKESYQKFISYSATEHEEYDKEEECWHYSFTTEPKNSVEDLNALNYLEELGWVESSYGIWYSLHPLVAELVVTELTPDKETCPEFYRYIRMLMKSTITPFEWLEADEAIATQRREFLCFYFSHCNYRIPDNIRMCVDWMMYAGYGHSIREYPFSLLYDKIAKRVLPLADLPADRFKVRYIMLSGWLAESKWLYRDTEEDQASKNERRIQIQNYFYAAKDAATQLESENHQAARDQIYSLINTYANDLYDLPEDFLKAVLNERHDLIQLNIHAKKRFHVPLSDAERQEEDANRAKWDHDPELQEMHRQDAIKSDYQNRFHDSDKKVQFVKNIVSDLSISPFERAQRIQYCTNEIFERFRYFYGNNIGYVEEIGWAIIGEILAVEEDWLLDDSWNPSVPDEWWSWNGWMNNNATYSAVTYAMLDLPDIFQYHWDDVLDQYAKKYSPEWHWSVIASDLFHYGALRDIIDTLMVLRKVSYILPFLVAIVEKLESYAKSFSDYEERYMYPLYQIIAECADAAWFEKGISREKEREYGKLRDQYQDKLAAITGKDYLLRFDD